MAKWRRVRLGEVCRFKYGEMPKQSDLTTEGYPVYSGYRLVGYSSRYHYREWFVRYRFPGHKKIRGIDSPLGAIPQDWECVAFTELADVLSGGTPKTDVVEYWNGEIPFFTPRDVPEYFYVQETEKHVTGL